MHMLSRKDLNSAELDSIRVSGNPTTDITAKEELQTNEEATLYVCDLDLLVTVQILEDTPAVLSLGKLCEDHGYSYEWTSGPKHILSTRAQTYNATRQITCLSLFFVNRTFQLVYEYHCGNNYYMQSVFFLSNYIAITLQSGWRRGIISNYSLRPRSLHGIIFQFRLQPRSRYGKTVSDVNIR